MLHQQPTLAAVKIAERGANADFQMAPASGRRACLRPSAKQGKVHDVQRQADRSLNAMANVVRRGPTVNKFRVLMVSVIAAASVVAVPLVAAIARNDAEPAASNLALLAGVIQLVRRDYVHPVGWDKLTKDALKGMLSRLDPHSDYMDAEEFKQSQADIAGRFGGLGMQISEQDGVPKIISPIDGTPAARAGLEPGDDIVLIDHSSTQGISLPKVVSLLRGDPGSTVTLTILRGKEQPFDVTLTREIIKVESVRSMLEPGAIGYIRITQFSSDTVDGFKKAIADLKRNANGHVRGLVLDLRDDPGGLLTAAVGVAGDLLDGGPVVSIHGRQAGEDQTFKAPAHGDILSGTPVVVLINGASAPPRRSLPVRCRIATAQGHGNAKLRQGVGADHHSTEGARCSTAHHSALLHPFGALDPG
jgi:carboxyl-terminal processing protease